MGTVQVIKNLKEKLEKYFIKDINNEWVNIEVINVNRIDIDIVSSIDDSLEKSKEFILKNIELYNENLESDESIYLGFLNIYNLDEADFLEIKRPIKRRINSSSFGLIIDGNNNNNNNNIEKCVNGNKVKVISFYSYKGGVGRTVALIQTANLLAAKGKKVALIDLDLEAPSFNEIFSEDIKSDKGLVKYLYNKLYDLEKIEVSSIVSKLNLNTIGDVYVVPTGDINTKYVKMLEKLKEKIISENNYIEDLIKELKEKYDIDYVLIDSRTGINNWGALSIGEIADEVLLFAYPNKENVKGINLILDIIKERKKCTVVFSRIDGSEIGRNKAKELFKEINITQEFIGIEYDSAIAIGSKYPIVDKLSKFNEICELILEEEINISNMEWINSNEAEVEKILNNLSNGNYFDKIITKDEMKFSERSNFLVVKNDNIDIEPIVRGFDGEKILSKVNFDNIKVKYYGKESTTYDIMNALISIALVNSYDCIEKLSGENKQEKYEIYLNRINEGTPNNTIENIDEIIKEIYKDMEFDNIYLEIDLKEILSFISNKFELTNKLGFELIVILINALNLSKRIQYKLILDEKDYNTYEDGLKENKANLINLTWDCMNEDILIENIREIFDKTLVEENFESNFNIMDRFIEGFKLQNKLDTNLIYCKRVDSTKYSKEFIPWLAEIVTEKNMLSKIDILNIIKKAAIIETDDKSENRSSIITFNSFRKAIKLL